MARLHHSNYQGRRPGGRSWLGPALMLVVAACALPSAAAAAASAAADGCSSGVLQLQPLKTTYGICTEGPLNSDSVRPVCMAGLRVRVADGVLKIVPLDTGTYAMAENCYYNTAPGPFPPGKKYNDMSSDVPAAYPFDCKDLNASGLLDATGTSASLMMFDTNGGRLSTLAKTGPHQVTLTMRNTHSESGHDLERPCQYQYAVAQGCVFGIRPPPLAPPPATSCPAGFTPKTGRFGTPFCAPCPPGTYSPGPGAPCKPCRPGYYSSRIGATGGCHRCPAGQYTSEPGAAECRGCRSDTDGVDMWTDGEQCDACPAGSHTEPWFLESDRNPGRCLRCQGGRKCCTVGWGADCPRCAEGSTPSNHTSYFELESTSPPSCLTHHKALCSPRIKISIGGDCVTQIDNHIHIDPEMDRTHCSWKSMAMVQGRQASMSDFAKAKHMETLHWGPPVNLADYGSTLTAAGPYLNIRLRSPNCTLHYRALTPAAATLLGLTPTGPPATTCPPGHHLAPLIDPTTTSPSHCQPCLPGTYSPSYSNDTSCIPCPAGSYTDRLGSPECETCPTGFIAAKRGAARCTMCQRGYYTLPGQQACRRCPKGAGVHYVGTGDRCLDSVNGTACCAAGNCLGQIPCQESAASDASGSESDSETAPDSDAEADPFSGIMEDYMAVLQLVNSSLPQPSCRQAAFLTDLLKGDKLMLTSYKNHLSLNLKPYSSRSPRRDSSASSDLLGGYTSTRSAYFTNAFTSPANDPDVEAYGLVSDPTMGTVTMYTTQYYRSPWPRLDDPVEVIETPPAASPACSATFRLYCGHAFGLAPAAGGGCDPSHQVAVENQICQPCEPGQFLNISSGACQNCPQGSYDDALGARMHPPLDATGDEAGHDTVCTPCTAGSHCPYEGVTRAYVCDPGTYTDEPGQVECKECPANTFDDSPKGAPKTKCTPCPTGTVAPKGATACGVPWDTVFPA